METEIEVKETKLPEDFKKTWLWALRSGTYKQGKMYLYDRQKNAFCCLGVACDIADPELNIDYIGLIANYEQKSLETPVKDVKIPDLLKGSFDTTDEDFNPVVKLLSNMNDDGATFEEIADYIEKNL